MTNEIWKQIEEFPDYEVSSLGRIKSLKYGKEKILKQNINQEYDIRKSLELKLYTPKQS